MIYEFKIRIKATTPSKARKVLDDNREELSEKIHPVERTDLSIEDAHYIHEEYKPFLKRGRILKGSN